MEGVVTFDAASGASALPGKIKESERELRPDSVFGKSTARGYNAPCFVGMVHFLRLSINTRGTMGTERTKESIYAGFA